MKTSHSKLPAAFALGLLMGMPMIAHAQARDDAKTSESGAYESKQSTGTDVEKSTSSWENIKRKIKGNKTDQKDTEGSGSKTNNGTDKSTY